MRRLAVFSYFFAAGIFLAQYLLPPGWLLACGAAALVLAWSSLLLPEKWRGRVLLAGIGLSLAFGYDWLYLRQVQRPMEALAETEQHLTMTVVDNAVPSDYSGRVTVKAAGLPGRLIYYGGEELLDAVPGQTISANVYLKSAARIREDDVTTFTSRGVFLLAYGRGEAERKDSTRESPCWWPARLGRAMRKQIGTLFSGDTASFLAAMLTGDKSGLSEPVSIAMTQAGIYHILAVSGMHCMFLLSAVTALAGRHRRRLVAGCTLPLLLFYALLTGCSPSVVRAAVMLSFYVAAPLFRRDSDGPTALGAALLLILVQNPFAIASVSLQLSFAAMAGILIVTPRLKKMLSGKRRHGKLFHFTVSNFAASIGALVFTIPLSAYDFNTLSLVAPLSNLLCLWAAGAAFLWGMASVLVSFLWMPLGALLGLAPRLLIWYILRVAEFMASLPRHAVYFSGPYLRLWLPFAYVLFALACLWRPRRRTIALAALLASVGLCASVLAEEAYYSRGRLQVLALDVGQGQSILLASGGEGALVDCGGSSWCGPGQAAADQLLTMGCSQLEYLVLTHYDRDHVSGVTALLERIPVKTLLLPETEDPGEAGSAILTAARAHGTAVQDIREETILPFGEAVLTVYPPLGTAGDNEQGLAALCTAGDFDMLITGDMNAATERLLLERYDLPDTEVLAAGHHGSKYSTSNELLETLTPDTAIISVGSNSYGHPADETLRRLSEHGAAVFRTDKQGTIHLTVN